MDDDQLLSDLDTALRDAHQVPAAFLAAGRAAFAWRDADAELAALSTAGPRPALTREDAAELRSFTFSARELALEVEVEGDALLGQIVPPQAGTIELHDRTGLVTAAPVDEVGWFAVRPLPTGLFRLRFRAGSGHQVLTEWVTL